MAEQYAHLVDNQGDENEPAALMTYLRPDAKTTPLAYYGRHATETRFRQNDGRRKVQVFFNDKSKSTPYGRGHRLTGYAC
jgi:hypothetical protein